MREWEPECVSSCCTTSEQVLCACTEARIYHWDDRLFACLTFERKKTLAQKARSSKYYLGATCSENLKFEMLLEELIAQRPRCLGCEEQKTKGAAWFLDQSAQKRCSDCLFTQSPEMRYVFGWIFTKNPGCSTLIENIVLCKSHTSKTSFCFVFKFSQLMKYCCFAWINIPVRVRVCVFAYRIPEPATARRGCSPGRGNRRSKEESAHTVRRAPRFARGKCHSAFYSCMHPDLLEVDVTVLSIPAPRFARVRSIVLIGAW